MSTYVEIINALQTLVGALDSITLAPTGMEYPESINADTMCPFAFSWPARPEWEQAAIGLSRDTTTLDLIVLIAPATNGIRGTVLQSCLGVLDDLRDLFLDPATQDLSDTIEQLGTITGEALSNPITYAGVSYWACHLTIPIILKEAR